MSGMTESCPQATEMWSKFEAKFKCAPVNLARKQAMKRLYSHADGCLLCQEHGSKKPYGLAITYFPWEHRAA